MLNVKPRHLGAVRTSSIAALLFGCGTNPSSPADAGLDSTLDVDVSDVVVADIRDTTGVEDTTDDVSADTFDSGSNDVNEPDVSELDAAGSDLDTGFVECSVALRCYVGEDSLVDGQHLQSDILAPVTCELDGTDTSSTYKLAVTDSSGAEQTYSSREGVALELSRSWSIGEVLITAEVPGECVVTGLSFQVVPPSTGTLVELKWSVDEQPTDDVDLDLLLFRDQIPCKSSDRVTGPGLNVESADWGVRFDSADDPRSSGDDTTVPGYERIWWQRTPSDETWSISVQGRTVDSASVEAAVVLYTDGVQVLSATRALSDLNFWLVAYVDSTGSVLVDEIQPVPGNCEVELCEDGAPVSPEECNGVDDDCDGSVDEVDEVCRRPDGTPFGFCAYFPEFDAWDCR